MSDYQFATLLVMNLTNIGLGIYATRQRSAQYELARKLHKAGKPKKKKG